MCAYQYIEIEIENNSRLVGESPSPPSLFFLPSSFPFCFAFHVRRGMDLSPGFLDSNGLGFLGCGPFDLKFTALTTDG